MVLQIISYDTGAFEPQDFKVVMLDMKRFYFDNGAVSYEVFKDSSNSGRFYELAGFNNREDSDRFDKIESVEKNELYRRFAIAGKVIGESVDVKILDKF